MTTVVYRDGVMAAEGRISEGNMTFPGTVRKVYKLPGGFLYGFSGSLELGLRMKQYLTDPDSSEPFEGDESLSAILVSPKGAISFYQGKDWMTLKCPYTAMGSGKEYAYGALAVGASAEEAVKAAMKFDQASGGKVQSVRLDK